jgi:aldehyde:ferredoxin oxidoreductase
MIYRVNLAARSVTEGDRPAQWAGLGGRALTSAIVAAEVPPRAWSLGPSNKLVLAPGLLGNSGASSSGRMSVGARSPLTGTIKESNLGGRPGEQLAQLGVEALIFEGRAEPGQWLVARVRAGGVDLLPGNHLAGVRVYDAVDRLHAEFGDKVGIMVIGQAGEHCLNVANIAVTDVDGVPARHAGRGGLGAVTGSKGLRAIVVDPAGAEPTQPADPPGLKEACRRFAQALLDHPVAGKSLPKYGTSALIGPINALGGLPTRNFRQGEFELADHIAGEALHDRIVARGGKTTHPCMRGCVVRCSNTYLSENGEELTRAFEYESIVLLGANCGIGDLDALARLNRACDEMGLDTMEMGVTLGVAMEAGVLAFGDAEGALRLIEEAGACRTMLGRVLGQGAAVTGRVFNVRRVPVVKGQAISAYDPRALKGIGVTCATSPMGADHTAGNCLPGSMLPDGTKPDPHSREHQIELSRYLQQLATMFDSLGLCWFTRGPILANPALLTDILAAQHRGQWTMDSLLAQARQTLCTEVAFNRAAGFTPEDDRLPGFFYEKPLSPTGLTFDISPEELQGMDWILPQVS